MQDFAAFLSGFQPPPASARAAPAAVLDTAEFRRIRDAERVDWTQAEDLPALVETLSDTLRTPSGSQRLRPIQAAALRCLWDLGYAVIPCRTGGGKTLIAFLAAEIVGAKRPLLVVPAKLINSGKTHRDHREARQHWRMRPIMTARASRSPRLTADDQLASLRVISYESLGRVDYAEALHNWCPDLIVLDECHKAKDPRSACTRNLGAYIRKARPALLLESGSLTNRSLGDYAHLLRWAMGDAAPLPALWDELQIWRWALDEKVPDGVRVAPGALLGISPPEPDDGEDIAAARRRYARRFRSTPGVVASGDDLPEVELTASVRHLPPSAEQRAAVHHLRTLWETPCGLPFELATELWRHEREVSAGFYYRWDEQPPGEWLDARRGKCAYVREVLSHSRTLYSPMAVANAVDAGRLDDGGVHARWREVRHLFDPDAHREAVWICDRTLEDAAAWLSNTGGLCWVYHGAVGRRLSELTGIPYFASGGRDSSGTAVDTHRGPAIVSIKAVGEGFNLQYLHCRNYILTTPTTNLENEQLISRTHRDGQPEEVELYYRQTLDGDLQALQQALADATYVEETQKQPQRLLAATWLST